MTSHAVKEAQSFIHVVCKKCGARSAVKVVSLRLTHPPPFSATHEEIPRRQAVARETIARIIQALKKDGE
ncbi:MAG: hypothetical protein DCC43_09105 [Candidatus Brocadia sp.]|nr:hypothetical protein [Candidatus Brocadia sp.]MCE7912237.1 hypothetical protein [Candidatus Brocadia sp. AMX3]OQZ01245.1 MAG: hypothetical protein B6D35_03635 [Candidatus Brocadia sp. UTAMX2]MDG5997495.1 hypothetical protein [Candidatus Brocadia sp.]RIJ98910.1 MAG: hypothetical protein DCC43_09105 [Candidatus Brocadia sp.]